MIDFMLGVHSHCVLKEEKGPTSIDLLGVGKGAICRGLSARCPARNVYDDVVSSSLTVAGNLPKALLGN